MRDDNCIFCKILNGEIPSIRLYEDGKTFAFMDINPANPGHALVIPKYHAANLLDIPAEWLTATTVTAQNVAKAVQKALAPDGINLLQANGPGAAQSVLHFHIHILPRRNEDGLKMNWGLIPGDMDEISSLAEKIQKALPNSM